MSKEEPITFREYRRFKIGSGYRYQINMRLVPKSSIPAYIHTVFGAINFQRHKQKTSPIQAAQQQKGSKPTTSNDDWLDEALELYRNGCDDIVCARETQHGKCRAKAAAYNCNAVPDDQPNDVHIKFYNDGYKAGRQVADDQLIDSLLESVEMLIERTIMPHETSPTGYTDPDMKRYYTGQRNALTDVRTILMNRKGEYGDSK